jgi:hypothetical protein
MSALMLVLLHSCSHYWFCRYADLERTLGEVDRARAIYIYGSQYCDPGKEEELWDRSFFLEMCRVCDLKVVVLVNSRLSYLHDDTALGHNVPVTYMFLLKSERKRVQKTWPCCFSLSESHYGSFREHVNTNIFMHFAFFCTCLQGSFALPLLTCSFGIMCECAPQHLCC